MAEPKPFLRILGKVATSKMPANVLMKIAAVTTGLVSLVSDC